MVFGAGFLLLVSLVLSAGMNALGDRINAHLPGLSAISQGLNIVLSFVMVTLLFALLFKALPDTPVAWRDVWLGAAATAVLFTFGKYLIGLYLGRAGLGSAYGAAGSLVVLVVWIYYSAQIVLLGAEFTQVHAKRRQG
jgi:membrane protein